MNGASAPPPFDEKAAEDLFGFLSESSAAQLRAQLLATKQQHENALSRLSGLANMTAQQANLQNQANWGHSHMLQGMASQQAQSSILQGVTQCMPAPQFGQGVFAGRLAPQDHALNEVQAHDHAMTMMNPLARDRYEAVIKLLNIKIRCVNRFDLDATTEWVLQKQIKDGRQVKFTWSVDDPGGGSFQHWKHMFSTLLDRCAELEGNDVPDTNNTADTQSAGV